jgi:transposase
VLEKIPARLKVIRHIRPKLSYLAFETIIQVPASGLPIEKGQPGSRLIANVVAAKYLERLPFYRKRQPITALASTWSNPLELIHL